MRNITRNRAALQLLSSPEEKEKTRQKFIRARILKGPRDGRRQGKDYRKRLKEKHIIEDIENALMKYEERIHLHGDDHNINTFELHLHHLRRIYSNASVAKSIGSLCLKADLDNARYPWTWIGERPEIDCPLHPKQMALPHEWERAYQCIYYIGLLLLGYSSASLTEQCTSTLETMPLAKLSAIYCLQSFLIRSSYRLEEPAKILGICSPRRPQQSLATEAEIAASTECTPEWKWAYDRIEEVYHRRVVGPAYERLRVIYGMCDRCEAGTHIVRENEPWDEEYATRGLCEENGAGRDLWYMG